ncbi:hypothetical protein CJ030_MR5G005012 [Morella rubra]|uniref:Uncharacterized protein n=1 Tax=Morella rubra TaxID=262757 RepID=A0A6A1VI68_9ROSI|nr:hypothetical protein CJ030_MR5G005012 [Morella rubra]
MDQKKGGLLQRAMPPKPTEGSRIRPIASTYNVMITLVYPFSLVVQRTVAPPTKKGINMETSLPFGSENLWRKSGFKFPETTRLYSQREYAAPKIIPSAANVATKLFLWKAPTKMGNSPIKLLVPGELILAKVEEKEMVERFGMVLTKPPFRAIHHVEKDQPPIVPFFYLEREVLLMMLRTAVRSARGKLGQNMTPEGPGARNPILSESEFTVPPALMLRDRNILLPSTAVTPEIKGSTRAPVLRRGGRTDRGLAPGVDRVKSAGIMQIHRPLPFSFG